MALTDDVNTTMLVQPSGGINYGNMGGGIFGNDGLWLLLVRLLPQSRKQLTTTRRLSSGS